LVLQAQQVLLVLVLQEQRVYKESPVFKGLLVLKVQQVPLVLLERQVFKVPQVFRVPPGYKV
jgi:hypothetical protein